MTIDEQIQEVIQVLERLDYGFAVQQKTDSGWYLHWWDHDNTKYVAHGSFFANSRYSFGVTGISFTDFDIAVCAFAEYMNWYRKFS
jgi:hypothetical protein